MTKKDEKALVAKQEFTVPTIVGAEGVQEEMEGLQFNFTYVKIPSGGQLAFELPGEEDDEPEYMKEIEGVIVYHHPVNVYWEHSYDGSNEPPDCISNDGRVGVGNPGGYCKTCPLGGKDAWGSGKDGVGKACQNRRRVYLLRDGEMFPMLFSLPPTSLQNFGNYISRAILQKNMRSYQVVSKAKLKKVSSGSGIDYSQVVWFRAGVLDEGSTEAMRYYSEEIKEIAHKLEYSEAEGETVNESDNHAEEDVPFS